MSNVIKKNRYLYYSYIGKTVDLKLIIRRAECHKDVAGSSEPGGLGTDEDIAGVDVEHIGGDNRAAGIDGAAATGDAVDTVHCGGRVGFPELLTVAAVLYAEQPIQARCKHLALWSLGVMAIDCHVGDSGRISDQPGQSQDPGHTLLSHR